MCLHDCLGKANTETKMLLNGCKNYSYIILQWSQEELWDCLCLFFDLLLSLTIQMSYFSLSGTNITAVICNMKGQVRDRGRDNTDRQVGRYWQTGTIAYHWSVFGKEVGTVQGNRWKGWEMMEGLVKGGQMGRFVMVGLK